LREKNKNNNHYLNYSHKKSIFTISQTMNVLLTTHNHPKLMISSCKGDKTLSFIDVTFIYNITSYLSTIYYGFDLGTISLSRI